MSEPALNQRDLETEIVERALKDPQFREKLVGNPREAIVSELEARLPEGLDIKVIEQEPDTVCLVLPPAQQLIDAQDQLSESELSRVAGGITDGCHKVGG